MADNFDVTPGTGAILRMIEKSSKKVQVVVLDLGGAGTEDLLTNSMPITNPLLTVDSNYCGQIYISSSSVNISGSTLNISNRNGFVFKSNPSNAGIVWIVNTGGSLTTGFPLSLDEVFPYSGSSLSSLDYGVTLATTGCLCWAKL